MSDLLAEVLRVTDARSTGPGQWMGHCPGHDDADPSLSIAEGNGGKSVLLHCFGGCDYERIVTALATKHGLLLGKERLHDCTLAGGDTPPPSPPLTLPEYAEAKKLPIAFLEELGLTTVHLDGKAAVKMPYYDVDGTEVAVRFRLTLHDKKDRFRWRSGSKAMPYGLWRLAGARKAGYVILAEGESDAQTLWLHGVPALGIPGASTWKSAWAGLLDGLKVYAWREPDEGGGGFVERISKDVPDAWILTPPVGLKDISEAYCRGDDVDALLAAMFNEAKQVRTQQAEALNTEAAAAFAQAHELLMCPDILAEVVGCCRSLGLVGEERTVKLLYLAVTSRCLAKPVSVVVKGPSSGGKSFTVEVTLRLFPPSAYYALSSMSERALAYSQEPLAHRMLVLYEAAGLTSDFGTYLLRTLLSEGHIRYETVESTNDGLTPKLIEREGPTGVLITTTWASLHPENETRMLSIVVRDDTEQTRGIFRALAERANGNAPTEPDLKAWHALQRWLELAGDYEVTIPYAPQLADMTSARAVRLRRDFRTLLNLIRAHALLHQHQRERDAQGRIVATLDDYRAVHDLVIDIVSEGVQASASRQIRETVGAVAELRGQQDKGVTVAQVARRLNLDSSTTSRRVRVAEDKGYLVNLESRPRQPAQLVVGDPLPEEEPVLPSPEMLGGGEGVTSPSEIPAIVQSVALNDAQRGTANLPSEEREQWAL